MKVKKKHKRVTDPGSQHCYIEIIIFGYQPNGKSCFDLADEV